MRILLVHYEWPGVTDCGGSGRLAKQLRDRLRARGHDVPLVTDDSDGHYVTFPARRHSAIREAIERHDPDLLFGHSTLPTSVGLPRLAAAYNVPLVVKSMGSDVYNPSQFTRIRPLLDSVNDYIFRRADHIVVQSRSQRGHIPTQWHGKTSVIPNGIDVGAWTWRQRQCHDPLRVVTVGRLAGVKNVRGGIAAVSRLRDQGVDATYRIVGDGGERPALERDFGHRAWIEFVGWADAVQPHYDWADVYLCPSKHESFGLTLVEAIATGLPVVTTETGGQTEVLRPGRDAGAPIGIGVPCNPASMATGLRSVTRDYQTVHQRTDGYAAQHFDLATMVDKYERLFCRLADVAEPAAVADERQHETEARADDPREDVPDAQLD